MRNFVFAAVLPFFVTVSVVACQADDDRPAFCRGPIPAKSLDVFEPCDEYSDACKVGECVDGFCGEPCDVDSECIRPNGFTGPIFCSGGITERDSCRYGCDNNYTVCPELVGGYYPSCENHSSYCQLDDKRVCEE